MTKTPSGGRFVRLIYESNQPARQGVSAEISETDDSRGLIGAHIELSFHPGQGLGIVRADPGQIAQMLTNLCINARDAMPDGGRITIETSDATIDEAY